MRDCQLRSRKQFYFISSEITEQNSFSKNLFIIELFLFSFYNVAER